MKFKWRNLTKMFRGVLLKNEITYFTTAINYDFFYIVQQLIREHFQLVGQYKGGLK